MDRIRRRREVNKEEAYRRISERYKRFMPKKITEHIRDEKDEESEFIVYLICEE